MLGEGAGNEVPQLALVIFSSPSSHSGKFYRKVHFTRTLADLPAHLTLDEGLIPAPVAREDATLRPHQPVKQKYKPENDRVEGV